MQFTIRDLTTYADMVRVHEVQQEIWGTQGSNTGLYPPVLSTAAKNGGVVLGGFDTQTGDLIAFLFGFLGKTPDSPLKLCSQVMGVLPAWRNLGLGEALKQAQRERVLTQGLDLITWTYDPLETRNAYLNLHKLRGISRQYIRDLYGSDFGALNAGLPSDRLLVEWWLRGERVAQAQKPQIETSNIIPILTLTGDEESYRIKTIDLKRDEPVLSLTMLNDIQALKAKDMKLALDWRMAVREALEHYFAQGYVITDFRTTKHTMSRQNIYILEKMTNTLQDKIGIR